MKIEQVVIKAQQGDESAFKDLYNYYHRDAYYFALKVTRNQADAEDVEQMTFSEIYQSLYQLREPQYFKRWMIQIVISKCNKIFRGNKTHALSLDAMEEPSDFTISTYRDHDPIRKLNFKETRKTLLQMISCLSYDHRIILLLQYFEEFSYQEISEILKIPLGTVKSRSSLARRELKKMILQYESQENKKLNFNMTSLNSVITAAFVMECGMNTSLWSTIMILTKKIFHKSTALVTQNVAIASSCVAITGLAITGGVFAAEDVSAKQNDDQPVEQMILPNHALKEQVQHTDENSHEATDFKSITFRSEECKTAKQAYDILISWAHCGIEMKTYSKEEIEEIMPIYNALKQEGGQYWNLLVDKNWNEEFEILI